MFLFVIYQEVFKNVSILVFSKDTFFFHYRDLIGTIPVWAGTTILNDITSIPLPSTPFGTSCRDSNYGVTYGVLSGS